MSVKLRLKLFHWLLAAAFCSYVIRLGIQNQLSFYIHPRYILFSLIMASLGLVICLLGMFFAVRPHRGSLHSHTIEYFGFLDLILVCILACTILLPPKPLLSSAADQRGKNQATSELGFEAMSEFKPTTVSDWAAIESSPYASIFNGRDATLTGFVYQPSDIGVDPNKFYVARFVISCCAVDAFPVTVAINYPDWQTKLALDSWVTIKGTYQKFEGSNPEWQFAAYTIQAAQQPNEPYEYTIPPQ